MTDKINLSPTADILFLPCKSSQVTDFTFPAFSDFHPGAYLPERRGNAPLPYMADTVQIGEKERRIVRSGR